MAPLLDDNLSKTQSFKSPPKKGSLYQQHIDNLVIDTAEKQTSIVTPAPPGLASMMEAQDTVAARRRDYIRKQEHAKWQQEQARLDELKQEQLRVQ